ncbi:MAG: zf-HC2 domain-containing protein [Chloroflexota bacterium]|nr:zf-HC2 domain-containing protein [Chloroflexota bacterium]
MDPPAGPPRHLDGDTLSAYADHALSSVERAEIDLHLASCAECHHELTELRATLKLLAGLPIYRPHRSFQLGPEHNRPRHSLWANRLVPLLPALRAAVLIVALALGGVGAADVFRSVDDQGDQVPQSLNLPVVNEDPATGGGTDSADQSSKVVGPAPPNERSAAPDTGVKSVQSGEEQVEGMAPASDAISAPAPATDQGFAAESAAPAPVEEPGSSASSESNPADDGTTWWRIAEVALALLLTWLLILWAAIRSVARRSQRRAALS